MKKTLVGISLLGVLCVGVPTARPQPVQPWGGAAVGDWTNASEAIVLSDMSGCSPADALSPMKLKKGHWKLIPYEMQNGPAGNMVWAPPEAGAPELSLPLGVAGWYAVFVGLFSSSEVPTEAWLRLNRDPAPVRRVNRDNRYYGNSEEVFFKVAQLDEKSRICISQQTTGFLAACGVTHVKLIPLSAAEAERVRSERADRSHRTLVATYDGFSDFYTRSPRTKQAVLSAVEVFRHTDFGTLILQSPGADKVTYPSQIGHMKGSDAEEFPRIGDRHFVEAIRELARQEINPVKVLIDGAHDAGMAVHVGIRPAGWSFFEPYSDYWESPFYRDHPQWRCEDRDGTPVARMSWAVPEVRRHSIELLREQVRFGADGAHLVFNRGYPVVLYEPSARKLFESKYGEDPRDVPESDPRITEWRSDVVTTFLRELRAMLDEEEKRRGDGTQLALSIMILGTAEDDLRFGVDVRRLVELGLVDEISTERGFGRSTNTYNLDLLRQVCQPKGIPFQLGMTSSANWFPEIPSYYDNGASGVAIWDAQPDDVYQWVWVSRFGHADEARWRLENLQLSKPPRTFQRFHRLGDQIRSGRYGPFWGG